jgi:hypothetical protein
MQRRQSSSDRPSAPTARPGNILPADQEAVLPVLPGSSLFQDQELALTALLVSIYLLEQDPA